MLIQPPRVVEHPQVLHLDGIHFLQSAIVQTVGNLGHGLAPPAGQTFGLSIPQAAIEPCPSCDLQGHWFIQADDCVGPSWRATDHLYEIAAGKDVRQRRPLTISLEFQFGREGTNADKWPPRPDTIHRLNTGQPRARPRNGYTEVINGAGGKRY